MPQAAPNSPTPAPALLTMLNPDHPLLKLTSTFDWHSFEAEFDTLEAELGRPPLPTRLMVGLHYLKAMYDENDESVG